MLSYFVAFLLMAQFPNSIALLIGIVVRAARKGAAIFASKCPVLVREWALNFTKRQHTSRDACQRQENIPNVGNIEHDERLPRFASIQSVLE